MSKTHLLQQGSSVFIITADQVNEKLVPGNYDLSYDQNKGFFLTIKDGFSLPEKIYGDPFTFAERVLSTYMKLVDKPRGMGVLLSGKKGTGKSITAKVIAAKSNLPVISISTPYTGQSLTNFIESIDTPCVFLVDEFEKTYHDPIDRNYLLSLLDGMSTTNNLWVLTSNEEDIGPYFSSRPGRIRYHKAYDTLDITIIDSIINDKVEDLVLREKIRKFAKSFYDLSPDSLISIIEEALMYNQDPAEFASYFNVRNEADTKFTAMLFCTSWSYKRRVDGLPEVVKYSDLESDLECVIDNLNTEGIHPTDEETVKQYTNEHVKPYLHYSANRFSSTYCSPFKGDYVNVEYMFGDEKHNRSTYKSIKWHKDDVDIERTAEGFVITNKDAKARLVLTVTKGWGGSGRNVSFL